MDKQYSERVDHYRRDTAKLRNLDELLARLWAVADIVSEQCPRNISGDYGESPPPLLAVLRGLIEALEKVARIEGKLRDPSSVITAVEINYFARVVVEIIDELVPAKHRASAYAKLDRIRALGTGDRDRADEPRAD